VTQASKSLLLIVPAFIAGWFAHRFITRPAHDTVQWHFVMAAERGDIAEMERRLQQGAVVGAEPVNVGGTGTGFPAIVVAAHAGQPEAVAWLLKHGADPNQVISDTWPLAGAKLRVAEATKTVDILTTHGAKNPFQ
jgi:hypothetical protein